MSRAGLTAEDCDDAAHDRLLVLEAVARGVPTEGGDGGEGDAVSESARGVAILLRVPNGAAH